MTCTHSFSTFSLFCLRAMSLKRCVIFILSGTSSSPFFLLRTTPPLFCHELHLLLSVFIKGYEPEEVCNFYFVWNSIFTFFLFHGLKTIPLLFCHEQHLFFFLGAMSLKKCVPGNPDFVWNSIFAFPAQFCLFFVWAMSLKNYTTLTLS